MWIYDAEGIVAAKVVITVKVVACLEIMVGFEEIPIETMKNTPQFRKL